MRPDSKQIEDILGKMSSGVLARSGPAELQSLYVQALWDDALAILQPEERIRAESALSFARSLTYHHPGLKSREYLLHPMRVASLSCLFNENHKLASIQAGLLHNVYEVAHIERELIAKLYGSEIESVLYTLKIDRERQADRLYLTSYYDSISLLPYNLGIIKVLDKIDNIYTLNLTANTTVKGLYLGEVSDFVIPLCEKVAPFLVSALGNMVSTLCQQQERDKFL
jgi:(p)ppGpp synthase/HD superfamily hydrolase